MGLNLIWSNGSLLPGLEFWEKEPNPPKLGSVTATPGQPLAVTQDHWTWLVAPLDHADWPSCQLWICDGAGQARSAAEMAALALAGQVMVRAATFAPAASLCGRWLAYWRQQRSLEQAVQVSGRLAHDLGNILTGVLGFSELMVQQLPASAPAHGYVQEVWQSAQQGAAWVRKLQWFSRRQVLPFQPANLADVVAQEEARVRPAWSPAVSFAKALPNEMPALAIETEALRQALAQLLDNAREAIADEGVVTLSARMVSLDWEQCLALAGRPCPGLHGEITVADTGAGLPIDMRGRRFPELFYSTKPRHRGLGLAAVYGIAQAFHGGVGFDSPTNRGAVARLFVPVVAPAPAPTNSAAVRPQGSGPPIDTTFLTFSRAPARQSP